MVCVGPASTTSHSHHNRDGCALARARMSRFLRVEARSVIHAHRWLGQRAQLMLWSKRLPVIPSESPALQWALHVRDRMVAEDAVTSFGHKNLAARSSNFCRHESFQIPLKKKTSSASTNGRRMEQRDAARAVLISSQRHIQSQPSKKQLRVWVRHKSAGQYRLPLRHHCRCRHRRRIDVNPRVFPCTALSCL